MCNCTCGIADGNAVARSEHAKIVAQIAQVPAVASALTQEYLRQVANKEKPGNRVRVYHSRVSVQIDMHQLKFQPVIEQHVFANPEFEAELQRHLSTRNWTTRFNNGHCELTAGIHTMPGVFIPQPRIIRGPRG